MKSRPLSSSVVLVATLLPEAFQTEQSAASHCAREAERLGDASPSHAMLAIAEHATRTLRELTKLVELRGYGEPTGAAGIGRLFSNLRNFGTDLVLSSEKSYRATLLGLHHGIDTVMLLEDAAIANGDQGLADLCSKWLSERTSLVAEAERDLAWFAQNPELAMSRAKPAFMAKLAEIIPLPEVLRNAGKHAA